MWLPVTNRPSHPTLGSKWLTICTLHFVKGQMRPSQKRLRDNFITRKWNVTVWFRNVSVYRPLGNRKNPLFINNRFILYSLGPKSSGPVLNENVCSFWMHFSGERVDDSKATRRHSVRRNYYKGREIKYNYNHLESTNEISTFLAAWQSPASRWLFLKCQMSKCQ